MFMSVFTFVCPPTDILGFRSQSLEHDHIGLASSFRSRLIGEKSRSCALWLNLGPFDKLQVLIASGRGGGNPSYQVNLLLLLLLPLLALLLHLHFLSTLFFIAEQTLGRIDPWWPLSNQECMAMVIQRYRSAEDGGYLLIGDDTMIDPCQIRQRDLSKAWYISPCTWVWLLTSEKVHVARLCKSTIMKTSSCSHAIVLVRP